MGARETGRTVRAEIRAIVDDAKLRGKPITSEIIWGLLARAVPELSCKNVLAMMVRAQQVRRFDNTAGGKSGFYEPGPVAVNEGRAIERCSMIMGFREHARLMAARKAAREWAGG